MLTRQTIKQGLLALATVMVFGGLFTGCTGGAAEAPETPLLSCRGRAVTVGDYQDALKLALQGYPYESLSSGEEVAAIRQGVLHQLKEELVLMCLADEKGVALGEEALETATARARAGYPEGAFEKELMDRGLSYDLWKRRLAKRLLMDKVLASEFRNERPLAYADFQAVQGGVPSGLSEEGLVQQVRRSHMEAAYRAWRRSAEGKYSIEVNGELWEKILEEGRP
ncbi:SurA N-terminal domain-containing protein [Desulfoluna spongiiphila]|uniref:hypothetical protein n=1 Tax=Desulfoluna spongiiphila TaxID=419481 RepID=UPI001251045C|nr:hypothetical protein [Desulfoluna spongiiphila]VVS95445.1 prokaryotic membrane lipoprotein lipid attachment site profile [Desulfoluna spongiiphila]